MVKEILFIVTFYCNCTVCTKGLNLTKSGNRPQAEFTVACDKKHLGRYVYLKFEGYRLESLTGAYKCEDTGSSIKENDVDIFVSSHRQALELGKVKVKGWWIP